MTSKKALSYKSSIVFLGIIVSLSLLTGLKDIDRSQGGYASLADRYGEPLRILTMKNAGRLCEAQFELKLSPEKIDVVINTEKSKFERSQGIYSISMIALSDETTQNTMDQEILANCQVKQGDLLISALTIAH